MTRAKEGQRNVERAGAQAGTDDAGSAKLTTLLWALLGGAVVWTAHLLVTYALVAYACTTVWRDGVRETLLAISVVALALCAWSGLTASRRWRLSRAVDRPTDDAWDARMGERTARVSFLMVTGLILTILFSIAIFYEALTLYLVPLCAPGAPA